MAGSALYDSLRSEWAAFFGLLSNERGIRLRLNLPDTLVFEHGEPFAWYATNKEGYVVQRPAGRTRMDDVRQHLLSCAMDGHGFYAQHVAIIRLADGVPKLLTRPAFEALCDKLSAQLEAGDPVPYDQAPCMLQAYVAPFLDLRFVTSYTNDGANISCHTFQRRFSRRYLQYRDPAQPALTASQELPLGTLAAAGPRPAAAAAMQGALAAIPTPAAAAASSGQGGDGADATADMALDDAVLADSERSLAKTVGPVDPSLKMLARKAAHGLVQYVQKAHLLTLRGLVCEFVRDSDGQLWFMGPLRTEWASLIPGRGGEPWANANLTQQVQDEESWPSTTADEVVQQQQQEYSLEKLEVPPNSGGGSSAEGSHQSQAEDWLQPGVTITGTLTSVTLVGPQGQRHTRTTSKLQIQQTAGGSLSAPAGDSGSPGRPMITDVTDNLLPAPTLHQRQQQLQLPGSPKIAPMGAAGGANNSLLPGLGNSSGSPYAKQPSSPQQAFKVAGSRSPPLTAQRERSPAASPGSRPRQQPHGGASPTAGGGTCRDSGYWGAGAGGGGSSSTSGGSPPPRGAAMLTSHLTKELVTLKDDLLVKTDLADALAYKVQALEHDKHVITGAFERVLGGMQGDLREVKERLEALRLERDRLSCQLAEVQQRLTGAEAERDHLRSMLDAERSTAFLSMGQFQKQQEDAGVRAARAEAELHSLQERLKEEQAASDALKKQMVFYQHAMSSAGLGEAGGSLPTAQQEGGRERQQQAGMLALRGQERPEVKYVETLQAVDELLLREADPTGERYSLSKVLHTCQGQLHATFLYYCMLDAGFTRSWPPQLTLAGWLAFMKDIGSTNLVPGTRTRSDATMHVQEATEVFRRYTLRQAIMKGTLPLRLSSFREPIAAAAAAAAATCDMPARPPSSHSTASGMPSSRPFSATSSVLAGASMTYQSFCAALVHVASKLARASQETLDACPFLSEQTRAFVESILPKAQQVQPIAQTKKTASAAAGAGPKQPVPGGMGAKEAAAKEAAAKLPKLKKKAKVAAADAAADMVAIAEASREGSSAMAGGGAAAGMDGPV